MKDRGIRRGFYCKRSKRNGFRKNCTINNWLNSFKRRILIYKKWERTISKQARLQPLNFLYQVSRIAWTLQWLSSREATVVKSKEVLYLRLAKFKDNSLATLKTIHFIVELLIWIDRFGLLNKSERKSRVWNGNYSEWYWPIYS